MQRSLQRDGDDPIEFLAFLVWYIFLVMCCLIPTCCAYRRRRIMERRLAEQQASMQHRLQQSNLLFLSNLSQHETGGPPSLERVRTQFIADDLASTTMTLEAHHFVDSTPVIPVKTVDDAATSEQKEEDVESQLQKEQDVSQSEEHTGWIRLPAKTNASESDDTSEGVTDAHLEQQGSSRLVPDVCTVCLCQYEEGESLTWSTRPECVHAFHTQCIISCKSMSLKNRCLDSNSFATTGLAKQDHGPQCPVCRQEFCSRSFMPAVRQEDEFLRTISQALLLTQLYARRPSGETGGVQLLANVRPEAEASPTGETRRADDVSDV